MGAVTQLGFLGLGQMGSPMALRLIGPDVALHVFDPSPAAKAKLVEAGAISHDSPRSVADAASIVMACLPNRKISEDAAFGPNGVIHGKAIRIYAEMSTIGTTTVQAIFDQLAARGIRAVDAPISGGPPGARAGTLAMMASGAADAVAQLSPWLGRIGRKVYVLGDRPGQAQVMKLVNNLVMAANMVVASEGLVMGAKAGLDPDLMAEVLKSGTGQSASADMLTRSALTGAFDFGAHLSIVDKDVQLGIAEAHNLAVPVPAIEQAGGLWQAASDAGRASEDFTAIIKIVEQRGGAVVRSAAKAK